MATLEQAARACEKLAEARFDEHGTREPDTGACYYGGRVEEEYQTRDEEDDECAKAIRALAATPASTSVAKAEPAECNFCGQRVGHAEDCTQASPAEGEGTQR